MRAESAESSSGHGATIADRECSPAVPSIRRPTAASVDSRRAVLRSLHRGARAQSSFSRSRRSGPLRRPVAVARRRGAPPDRAAAVLPRVRRSARAVGSAERLRRDLQPAVPGGRPARSLRAAESDGARRDAARGACAVARDVLRRGADRARVRGLPPRSDGCDAGLGPAADGAQFRRAGRGHACRSDRPAGLAAALCAGGQRRRLRRLLGAEREPRTLPRGPGRVPRGRPRGHRADPFALHARRVAVRRRGPLRRRDAAERLDHAIAALLGGRVSGHTLKHLLAAAAIYVVYRMLLRRRRAPIA